jgi:hypothetical protein
VVFETTADPGDPGSPAAFAHGLMRRTLAHFDKVKSGPIIEAFLAEHPPTGPAPQEILRLTALVETVLDQAATAVANGLATDIALTVIPRLDTRSSQ